VISLSLCNTVPDWKAFLV